MIKSHKMSSSTRFSSILIPLPHPQYLDVQPITTKYHPFFDHLVLREQNILRSTLLSCIISIIIPLLPFHQSVNISMTICEKLGIFTPIYDKSWGIWGSYAIPHQNKISNFRPLILEEQSEV